MKTMAKKRERPKKNSAKKDSDSQAASNRFRAELVALGQSLREGSERQKLATLSEVGEYGWEGLNLAVEVLRSSSSSAQVKEAAYALVQKLASQIDRALRESDPNPDPEVYAIGVFEARNEKIRVNVKRKGIPLVLVLTSRNSAIWEINPEVEVTIGKVIVSGYYLQQVMGIEPHITVESSCYRRAFVNYKTRLAAAFSISMKIMNDEGKYFVTAGKSDPEAARIIQKATGLINITALQNSCYRASEFTIGDELTTKVWRDR